MNNVETSYRSENSQTSKYISATDWASATSPMRTEFAAFLFQEQLETQKKRNPNTTVIPATESQSFMDSEILFF